MTLFLDKKELKVLTGKSQAASQREALALMRVPFLVRPDGRPIVFLRTLEQLIGPDAAGTSSTEHEPDFSSLQSGGDGSSTQR